MESVRNKFVDCLRIKLKISLFGYLLDLVAVIGNRLAKIQMEESGTASLGGRENAKMMTPVMKSRVDLKRNDTEGEGAAVVPPMTAIVIIIVREGEKIATKETDAIVEKKMGTGAKSEEGMIQVGTKIPFLLQSAEEAYLMGVGIPIQWTFLLVLHQGHPTTLISGVSIANLEADIFVMVHETMAVIEGMEVPDVVATEKKIAGKS